MYELFQISMIRNNLFSYKQIYIEKNDDFPDGFCPLCFYYDCIFIVYSDLFLSGLFLRNMENAARILQKFLSDVWLMILRL